MLSSKIFDNSLLTQNCLKQMQELHGILNYVSHFPRVVIYNFLIFLIYNSVVIISVSSLQASESGTPYHDTLEHKRQNLV